MEKLYWNARWRLRNAVAIAHDFVVELAWDWREGSAQMAIADVVVCALGSLHDILD